MKSDKFVKWFFVAVVLFFVAMAIAPFIVSEDTRKENQAKAEKIAEKMRYKPSKSE
jgi:nitric oxide reductase large subunit